MNREKVVHLKVSSWRGMSLGATHYYGELVGDVDGKYTVIEVSKIMTEEDAEKLSKKDDWKYHAGGRVTRFEKKNDIYIAVLGNRFLFDNFPKCEILLLGNNVYCEPKECLWAKDAIWQKAINAIYETYKTIDSLDRFNQDKLTNLFDKAIDSFVPMVKA